MKDSGIEWIGEIPDDWKVSRIKYFCKIINGFPFDSNDFGRDFPFKVVRIGDIQNDTVDWENCVSVSNNNIKSCNLCKGDAIIALSGATVGKTAFINDEIEDCYINQRVAIIRSTHIKYILYTLKTIGFAEYVTLSSSGSAQPNLSTGQIGNYYFLVSDKQDLIVNFLDKKCTEIDCLIAHEEAMIDELKAYKQSVITEAVTKGLDRTALMKDSGVEWIGEIPEDWKVSRIKYFCKIINGFPFDSNDFGRDLSFKVVRIGDIQNDTVDWENCVSVSINNIKNCNLRKGDAIIALSGATVGKTAFINDEIKDCYINQRVAIIRSTHIKYILYTLKTIGFAEYVTLSSSGSAQPNLSTGQMGNYYLLVSDKQDLIVHFLERKCSEIDRLISLKHAKIEELRDYKKSLIYEYVTGKKEVV